MRVRTLHRDVVLCVSHAPLPVSCCGCFVAGALRRSHTEGQQPPNPKGWILRSRRTSHLDRPRWRPCRKSPGLFVLSLSHSSDRDGSGLSIHARASPALLNAGATGESTSSGGLKASSPLSTPAGCSSEFSVLAGGRTLSTVPGLSGSWDRTSP